MPEKTILATYLKSLRQKQKESQFEFAANIGISLEELSLLERELANPSLQTLQKIAAYTGKTVAELLKKEDPVIIDRRLDVYFNSAEYNKTTNSEEYQFLLNSLQNDLENRCFLEFEEQLNTLIIKVAEKSYIAGYLEASVKNNV